MRNIFSFLFYGFVVVMIGSCANPEVNEEEKINEIPIEGTISSIIRNPVSADPDRIDTINVAKLTFEELEIDFGEVDQGAVLKHEFRFTNTGKTPLLITHARSTCGCTVPHWPNDPINSGEHDSIEVVFDTTNKTGYQSKPVTITANTFPGETVIYVKAKVNVK